MKNRCIILDIIKEYYNIDIIIKTFQTKSQTYGGANIEWFERNYFSTGFNYNETQICATDNKCIKNTVELSSQEGYKQPEKIWFQKKKRGDQYERYPRYSKKSCK